MIVFAARGSFRGLFNPFCIFLERKGLVDSFVSVQWRPELPGLTFFNDRGWMVAHSERKGCTDAIAFSVQLPLHGQFVPFRTNPKGMAWLIAAIVQGFIAEGKKEAALC